MPENPGVVVVRFPAGQSLSLHSAVGGLLNAALESIGEVSCLRGRSRYGTAALLGETSHEVPR